jgi:hypothetical protein
MYDPRVLNPQGIPNSDLRNPKHPWNRKETLSPNLILDQNASSYMRNMGYDLREMAPKGITFSEYMENRFGQRPDPASAPRTSAPAMPATSSPSVIAPTAPASSYQGQSYLGGMARLKTDPQTGFDRMSYADGVDVSPARQAFQRGMNLIMDQGPQRDPMRAQKEFQMAYRLAKAEGMTGPEMDKIQQKAQDTYMNNQSLRAGTMIPYYKTDRDPDTGEYIGPNGKYIRGITNRPSVPQHFPGRNPSFPSRTVIDPARMDSSAQESLPAASPAPAATPSPSPSPAPAPAAAAPAPQATGGTGVFGFQTYRSSNGFAQDAAVMGIRDGNAVMQYPDGTVRDVPLDRLDGPSREQAIAAASARDFVRGADADGMPVNPAETMNRMFGGRDRNELYSSTTGRITAGDPDAYTRQQAFNSTYAMAPPENPEIREDIVARSASNARNRFARATQPGGMVSTDALNRMYEREEYERNAPLRSLAQRPDVTSNMGLGYTRSVDRDPNSENFGRAVVNEGLDVGQLRLGKGLAQTDYGKLEQRNEQRDKSQDSTRDLRTRTAQIQSMYPGVGRAAAAGVAQSEMESRDRLQAEMKRQQEIEERKLKIQEDEAASRRAQSELQAKQEGMDMEARQGELELMKREQRIAKSPAGNQLLFAGSDPAQRFAGIQSIMNGIDSATGEPLSDSDQRWYLQNQFGITTKKQLIDAADEAGVSPPDRTTWSDVFLFDWIQWDETDREWDENVGSRLDILPGGTRGTLPEKDKKTSGGNSHFKGRPNTLGQKA